MPQLRHACSQVYSLSGLCPYPPLHRLSTRVKIHRFRAENLEWRSHSTKAGPTTTRISPPLCCSILNSTSSQHSPDKILSLLPQRTGSSATAWLAIFLVTPSLAHWFEPNPSNQILSRLIDHVLQPSATALGATAVCQAVVAVVDRLPDTTRAHVGKISESGSDPAAYEGISMCLLETESRNFENIKLRDHASPRSGSSQISSISFSFKDELFATAQENHTVTTRIIQLPLANTLFQTGKHSTLFSSRWVLESGSSEFTCVEHTEPSSIKIDTSFTNIDSNSALTKYHLPLVAITPPREVGAAMGNIVRQLVLDKAAPASQELEKSLTDIFSSLKLPQQPLPVWALVIPKSVFSQMDGEAVASSGSGSRTRFQSPESVNQDLIAGVLSDDANTNIGLYIEAGAHVHRVLSGGGGWGQKRGLLSLDPHTSYSPDDEENAYTNAFERHFSEPEELSVVASPGDFIQFFISPVNLSTSTPFPRNENTQVNDGLAGHEIQPESYSHALVFGTTTSSIFGSSPPSSETVGPGPSDPIVSPHFGALSEQGISLTIERVPAGAPRSAQSRVVVHETKLDVPCMKLSRVTYDRKET